MRKWSTYVIVFLLVFQLNDVSHSLYIDAPNRGRAGLIENNMLIVAARPDLVFPPDVEVTGLG